jgi:primosomal protein N'
MAKKKAKCKGKGLGVYRVGEKYHCEECHQEVPIKQACPICKKEVDWDRALVELRR